MDLHRALEASKESFANEAAQTRPPVVERVPDPVHDFPTLNGAAPATSSTSHPLPTPAAKSHVEDFPSLSSSRSNGSSSGHKQQASAPSKAYSSVMNPPAISAPVAEKKESRPVPLGLVSSASKGRYAAAHSAPPGNSEDDYPSLGGSAPRSLPVSQGSWLLKNPSSTSASAVAASKTLAISKVPSRTAPVTKAAPFKKSVSDEKEFPSLGGRDKKTLNGFGGTFSEWSKAQNGVPKKPVTPKSERITDDSFQLPDSYYTSVADPTTSSNITVVESVPEPVVKASPRPVPTSGSTKDFPGLPAREKKVLEVTNEKKKKKNNKKTRDKPKGPEKNPTEETNFSLSEIALALVKPESNTSNLNNFSSSSREKSSVQKPTDWFDSPSEELTKTSKPSPQQQRQLNGSSHKAGHSPVAAQDSEASSSSVEESFPSLHSMSTSVQLQPQQLSQGPPGFSVPNPATTSVPTPPPGFRAPASMHSDLKAISSTLTPVPAPPPGFTQSSVYIQPPEFKRRNGKLIEDIREALETVEDGFMNFRALSGQFRQGMMEASDYYCCVKTLVGAEDFDTIFPELLALLPDIMKQKQLWEVHQAAGSGFSYAKRKASPKSTSLSQCSLCGQVTRLSDVQHHSLQHGETFADSENFPSLRGETSDSPDLSATTKSGLMVNGSWIKAK